MKPERGGNTNSGERPGGERQLPADQKRRARAQFERDHQRKQQSRDMVGGHMIEERLRAGDLGGSGENEERRQQTAADKDRDGGWHGMSPLFVMIGCADRRCGLQKQQDG